MAHIFPFFVRQKFNFDFVTFIAFPTSVCPLLVPTGGFMLFCFMIVRVVSCTQKSFHSSRVLIKLSFICDHFSCRLFPTRSWEIFWKCKQEATRGSCRRSAVPIWKKTCSKFGAEESGDDRLSIKFVMSAIKFTCCLR